MFLVHHEHTHCSLVHAHQMWINPLLKIVPNKQFLPVWTMFDINYSNQLFTEIQISFLIEVFTLSFFVKFLLTE